MRQSFPPSLPLPPCPEGSRGDSEANLELGADGRDYLGNVRLLEGELLDGAVGRCQQAQEDEALLRRQYHRTGGAGGWAARLHGGHGGCRDLLRHSKEGWCVQHTELRWSVGPEREAVDETEGGRERDGGSEDEGGAQEVVSLWGWEGGGRKPGVTSCDVSVCCREAQLHSVNTFLA